MDLPPESIIKETDCVLGTEVGRGAFGAVSLAVLKGSVQACAKVRARCACTLFPVACFHNLLIYGYIVLMLRALGC